MPSIRPSPRISSITSGKRSLSEARPWRKTSATSRTCCEEAIGQDDVEHGIADGHGQRIAAIGRAMGAGLHAGGGFCRRKAGAERKAAADALGDRHDVGRDARPFMGKELAGAADAATGPRRRSAAGRARRRARAAPAGIPWRPGECRPRPGPARSGSPPSHR